jgi:hypothetical protein
MPLVITLRTLVPVICNPGQSWRSVRLWQTWTECRCLMEHGFLYAPGPTDARAFYNSD